VPALTVLSLRSPYGTDGVRETAQTTLVLPTYTPLYTPLRERLQATYSVVYNNAIKLM